MRKRLTVKKMEEYRISLLEEEKSRATIEKYMRDLKKLYDYLPAGKWVDKEQVCAFKADLIDRYRASSVNSMLAAVNSFLGYMEWDMFKVKQVRIQRRMFRAEERELSAEEYKRLLKAASQRGDERLYLMMLTICATGIRVSELPYITREVLLTGRAEVVCKNKTRVILLPTVLKKQLLVYSKKRKIHNGSIFITRSGNPVDRRNIWTQMKSVGRQAGIDLMKVYPHNLRHLFARTYYSKQKDIVKLADILGHATVETTRIYTCTTMQEHRVQIDRLGLMPAGTAYQS